MDFPSEDLNSWSTCLPEVGSSPTAMEKAKPLITRGIIIARMEFFITDLTPFVKGFQPGVTAFGLYQDWRLPYRARRLRTPKYCPSFQAHSRPRLPSPLKES